jgi:hypothetical protein
MRHHFDEAEKQFLAIRFFFAVLGKFWHKVADEFDEGLSTFVPVISIYLE